jgi:MFS family permease
MTYFDEFRLNWRQLLAASVGMAFGYTLNNYLSNVFIPPLVREFHWPRSSVALIGLTALLSLVFQPLAGRVTDRLGVRPVALVGVIAGPALFIVLSLQHGVFWEFFALNVLQITFFASTTGAVVYSRLIAQDFDRARGMALAIAACSPSVAGAFIAPSLSRYIELHGWRPAYVIVAVATGVAGLLAVSLMPAASASRPAAGAVAVPATNYRAIFRNPAFKFIALGMGVCSLSVTVQASQLKFIIESMGVEPARAALLISFYATGVIVGRLSCGVALDRFSPYLVAAVSLGLPGIGLLMLSIGTTTPIFMALAVIMLGLSLGTELDVAGYLIMRYFELAVYSAVLGLVIGVIALFGSIGSLILSATLHASESYSPYMLLCSLAAFVGSWLFLLLRKCPQNLRAG